MTELSIEELLKAFKALGGDENGKIDFNRITTLLCKKTGFTRHSVSDLLESDKCKKGKELDFISLCISILSTKETLDHILQNDRPVSGKRKLDSRTFTRRKGSGRSSSSASGSRKSENNEPITLHAESVKGCIFNTDPFVGLCGHRFLLQLNENSPVEIIAQAIDERGCCGPTPAVEILMFIENDEPNKKLVTFSSFVNSEGYCIIKMNLRKGKYLLVPVTLDWKGEGNPLDADELESLYELADNDEAVLTQECKIALKTVFDCIDLDRNGMLSEQEFDLFIQHICGETAADEWSTVEDNFDTVNGQLTFDGFLSLYKMALVTDFNDVASMFKKMGLNNELTMSRSLPFLLTVTGKLVQPILTPLSVATFDSLMEVVFRKTAMEQGQSTKIRNMNDLLLYSHELAHRVTLVVKNMSHSTVKVKLDCQNSQNCVSHRGNLDEIITIGPKTSVVGHHLFPGTRGEPWSVQCIESLVE